jgi:DNA-binding winged helix-turn-helix (wHTH) protein/tetratricopeptide (TPR) repeat protein
MDPGVRPKTVDLAREPDFALGGLEVSPATLETRAGERRVALEPRVMQVLTALAQRRGEVVSRDTLNDLCWGGRVVGDDALNRCIGRLRRLAQTHGGFVIETVPRVGFRLVEGRPARQGRPWRAVGLLAAVALLAIAAAGWTLLRAPPRGPRMLQVAVEPVRVAPDDSRLRALAAAIGDELQDQVSVSGAQAVAPGARGAQYRLAASLTGEGTQGRVVLSLADRRTGATLWSQQVVAAPEPLRRRAAATGAGAAQCLARALAPNAGPIGQDALKDYLRACVLVDDPNAAAAIFALLERVTAHAPQFAVGHSGLATFAAIASKDVDEPLKSQLKARGHAEAERALKLNPAEGTAYLAQELLVEPRADWAERQRLLSRGLAVDPQNFALLSRQGQVLSAAGRLSEAEAFHRQAVALNPFAANSWAELALTQDSRNALDVARGTIDKAYARWPDNEQVQEVRLGIEALHGDPRRALADLRNPDYGGQIANPEERRLLGVVIEARLSGSPAQLANARESVRAALKAGLWPPLAVQMMGALGDVEGGLAAAERAAQTHAEYEPGYLFRGATASLRRDPRFMRVAKAWGLLDYWRATGRWPDFCGDAGLPYDCAKAADAFAR